jgi:HSP20 family protein
MKYRQDPFGDFFEIQKQMDQMFDAFLQQTVAAETGRLSVTPEPHLWRPAIDVYETVDTFIVKMEIPGIQPDEDVRVTLEGNRLTIRGHRRDRTITKKEHYHLAEVNYGPFERVIGLPDAVDDEAIPSAKYDNGFLEIVVPKVARPKPREIAVEVPTSKSRITIEADSGELVPDEKDMPHHRVPVKKEDE